ncbi:hypothetical protein CP532_6779 [Ophiocordyceps camponoti-leonardi (nom. inval.)]|nr:hypothetical protein CP532_6779 [Ophiocordyceps camponoti-leonardi (nom. inval.)]
MAEVALEVASALASAVASAMASSKMVVMGHQIHLDPNPKRPRNLARFLDLPAPSTPIHQPSLLLHVVAALIHQVNFSMPCRRHRAVLSIVNPT